MKPDNDIMKTTSTKGNVIQWPGVVVFLLLAIFVSGCGVFELGAELTPEPSVEDISPGAQGALSTVGAESTVFVPAASATTGADPGAEIEPTPTPVNDANQTETSIPDASPTDTPTPVTGTATPSYPTPTPAQPPATPPTPTPVAPLPGLLFRDEDGLWWVTAGPVFLTDRGGAGLSPDGRYILYLEDDDVWIRELATGEERDLTGSSGRVHCCARWWPSRPGTIVFGSWPDGGDIGPTDGFLSAVNIDGSEYRVLDEEVQSTAQFGPGPDGQTIAYDRGGASWLYNMELGLELLDPAAYGLENVVRIGGPAWSPDGQKIAWTVAITDPEWRIALAIFDLSTGSAYIRHPYENAGRGGWFPPPAWSPDGRWLAFVTEDIVPEARGIWVVAADSGAADGEAVYLGPGWNPVWSPDGRYLAYNSDDAGQSIPRLVVPDSWYQIPFALRTGSTIVDWIEPS
jgi:Tol biopolymer transport system component